MVGGRAWAQCAAAGGLEGDVPHEEEGGEGEEGEPPREEGAGSRERCVGGRNGGEGAVCGVGLSCGERRKSSLLQESKK